MLKEILRNDLFYCEHLEDTTRNKKEVNGFSVCNDGGTGLVNYIQNKAFQDEARGMMRTYLARDSFSSELAGYYSLKAGLISVNEVHTENGDTFDTIPGIELANFAVNYEYLKNHPELEKIGIIIFNDFIIPTIQDVAKYVGVKIIYIFALPFESLLKRYNKYGFRRLNRASEVKLHKRLKPEYDKSCVFMYQVLD